MRTRLAWRIGLGAAGVTLVIFLIGEYIMRVFGITVDAFLEKVKSKIGQYLN